MSNQGNVTDIGAGVATGGLWNAWKGLGGGGGGGGSGNPEYPSVIPAFQGDVNWMRDFAHSMGGQKAPTGAFMPSPGTMGAAGVGNNYFSAGGVGSQGLSQFSDILSGRNLMPGSNPFLQGNIQAMQQAFGQTLGQGTDMLNAQFAGSGQFGGNSGARNNALTQFGRGTMSDFSNSLTGFLGNNYMHGQDQITSALGMMGQPLQTAGMASALGQVPGQLAVQGQEYQNQLSEMPFNLLKEMMSSAPVGYPQYQPYQPGFMDYLMQGMGSAMGNLPLAFAMA